MKFMRHRLKTMDSVDFVRTTRPSVASGEPNMTVVVTHPQYPITCTACSQGNKSDESAPEKAGRGRSREVESKEGARGRERRTYTRARDFTLSYTRRHLFTHLEVVGDDKLDIHEWQEHHKNPNKHWQFERFLHGWKERSWVESTLGTCGNSVDCKPFPLSLSRLLSRSRPLCPPLSRSRSPSLPLPLSVLLLERTSSLLYV